MVYTALRNFAIVSGNGAMVYLEGQTVPEAIAKQYPMHIVGLAKEEKPVAHNPNLKAKPSRKEIAKMSEDDLKQWITQFHPGSAPVGDVNKAGLVEIVVGLVD
jgi:hypothetical protein